MFESARLKLTAWYLAIIMAISLMFSFVIYTGINTELQRFERVQLRIQRDIDDGLPLPASHGNITYFGRPDPEMLENSRKRLVLILAVINACILFLSGVAGYFLAGRTLKPIKKMVEEQKRFVTDASHELRTPLTALRSEIEVGLRNKQLDLPAAKKLLASNLEEAISLQVLSDNLLLLSQNGKKISLSEIEAVSLAKVVLNAIKKVKPLATKKEITFENKTKEIFVKGVADRLTEIFVILLDNAIKYSAKGSKVEIIAKVSDKQVAVLVKDNGMGIAEKDLPYIFDRFYRADSSRSKTSGYGLGLSIAKKIITAHDGTITVESKKGKGTTFKVIFRLLAENKV